ncbi:putative Golgi matrix protein [Eremomyces bilateralis CBS 781.70]|uniref:Golgi matrix protein n=1 Tax=Eremomyces bilateralis CBS 781.70 TaxID=1392243 RepID=A0A6G1G901_9PEZI|nr:putative Golgi matrix protein [Eremomyces bilateralis CBS 781.70]KAF1814406.1 putative Golgi matrix protein [Eremomyces bilateralis CBS 781.70]
MSDPVQSTGPNPKSKKKNKKKKGGGPKPGNQDNAAIDGHANKAPEFLEPDDEDTGPPGSPADTPIDVNGDSEEKLPPSGDPVQPSDTVIPTELSNGLHTHTTKATESGEDDTESRLEAMARERDDLKAMVADLRESLESIHKKHEEDLGGIREELEESQSAREHAESQYQKLLGKVNTIRSQLTERLKGDAEELAQAQEKIKELEERNEELESSADGFREDLQTASNDNKRQSEEIADLRNRASLSQQNWIKERDELISREAYAREEFETARQAMLDWEILATEERSKKESLADRVGELEEQLGTQREAYDRAAADRDSQSQTVESLQRALKDIQEARKKELREMVEQSETQLGALRKQHELAEEEAKVAKQELDRTTKELERATPFEKEVKEKNLLIGKLRHEAVILNDHLTKALRFLKQRKPEDMVDRQLVTNHFLQFLALDRSDPKKFQVLQLTAAILCWDDEQRERAGLSRPGASNSTLRVPMSPFRRTSSIPSLTDASLQGTHSPSKESLAELWSDFLEREAQEGSNRSRRPSTAHNSPASEKPPPGL